MLRNQNPSRPAARYVLPVLLLAVGLAATTAASAQTLNVKLRTDRGDGAVYQPGDPISLSVKTNHDANLLVYEIDAEGAVHLLFPYEDMNTAIEGGTTLELPGNSDEQMVVEGPVGEGYVVAIASDEPFRQLPWYLRPIDPRAEEMGYTSSEDRNNEGVTRDGKIVGDPFVAMERIRRAVLAEGVKTRTFATVYSSYYVHNAVRYPRYLCNDCHRPGYYSWWDGFDPYYANCSVFQFRVNSGWWWGPTYWTSCVPYYAYVFRNDCPPRYRPHGPGGIWYSSWDGWPRWKTNWGGPLRREKSPPPTSYVPPSRWRERNPGGGIGAGSASPPGFLASAHDRWSRTGVPGGGTSPSGIRRERIGGEPSGTVSGDSRSWNREGRRGDGGREVRGGSNATPLPSGQERGRRGWEQGNGGSGRSGSAPDQGAREPQRQSPTSDRGQWKASPPPQPRQEAPAPRNPERGAQRGDSDREAPRNETPPPQSTPPPASPDRPQRGDGGRWNP